MRPRNTKTSRRGASMVEAAIILPIFLTLILGMLDLSVGVFRQHVVSQAARHGARRAIVHGKMAPPKTTAWGTAAYTGNGDASDEIATAIKPSLTGLDPAQTTIQVQWIDGSNDVESRVRVTVSTTWTPIMLALLGGQKTLTASSTMPIAH